MFWAPYGAAEQQSQPLAVGDALVCASALKPGLVLLASYELLNYVGVILCILINPAKQVQITFWKQCDYFFDFIKEIKKIKNKWVQ